MRELAVKTDRREQMLPLNAALARMVREEGWRDGVLLVFCPHTTASITINESADPDVRTDICAHLRGMVPESSGFLHAEGNSDSHIKAGLFGPHCLVIIQGGLLRLGTWQEVYFCEWDGPRNRSVWLQFLPSGG